MSMLAIVLAALAPSWPLSAPRTSEARLAQYACEDRALAANDELDALDACIRELPVPSDDEE